MGTKALVPKNRFEAAITHGIVYTWPYYGIGATYILAPVMAWGLFALAVCLLLPLAHHSRLLRFDAGYLVMMSWVIGMLVMEVALINGHNDFELGTGKIIKSTIGWMKGWALFPVFIGLGYALPVRPAVIFRSVSIVCRHTLFLIPIFVGAYIVGLPGTLFISPLKAVGGPGPEFFEVQFYGINPESQAGRWRFFTPWAPAAGMVANFYIIMLLQDTDFRNKVIGVTACILMCLLCQSRAGLVCLFVVIPLTTFISRFSTPVVLIAMSIPSLFLGFYLVDIIDAFELANASFKAQRPGSSRVRGALAAIAMQRYEDEAPIWGHGIVESGPHLVEYMPIGSHHNWYGLLFVKGVVGFYAFAIPMGLTMLYLMIRCQKDKLAGTGLGLMFVMFLFSMGENLEILAYLYWPALIVVGMALRSEPYKG